MMLAGSLVLFWSQSYHNALNFLYTNYSFGQLSQKKKRVIFVTLYEKSILAFTPENLFLPKVSMRSALFELRTEADIREGKNNTIEFIS